MTTNAELNARRQRAVPRGVSNSLMVYAERASNAEIWDVEGRRDIDFASGISVLNTGHVHPKVQAAIGLPAASAGFQRSVQVNLDGAPDGCEAE